jgi:pre-mRNA-splicing factor SPF27
MEEGGGGQGGAPEGLIDSLAYIDREYDDPATQQAVHDLLEAEMATFRPKDYLAHLPYPRLWMKEGSLVAKEMARLEGGGGKRSLDMSKYEAHPPSDTLAEDVNAWRQAVSNAQIQVEYQKNRLINLELMAKFGPTAWLTYNEDALKPLALAEEEKSKRLRRDADAINAERRQAQEAIAQQLWQANMGRYELADKNMEIAVACAHVKQDIARLEQEREAKGQANGATPSNNTTISTSSDAQ